MPPRWFRQAADGAMPRGHGVGLFAGQAGVWWSSRSFCRSCPHRGFSEAVAASFQAAAPSGLGPPMQQTIGGVPFMCYKVKQIARLAGPGAGPADTQPLLLSMPGAAAGSPAGA
ncbi:unnamed protein product, partial [Prorocentrum cordatum]